MNAQIFTQIVIGIILIISGLVSAYVIPLIETKIDIAKMEQLYSYVKKAVQWANQTIPAEQWEKKKHEVFESVKVFMSSKLHIELTDDQLDKIIEAFVIECKKENKWQSYLSYLDC